MKKISRNRILLYTVLVLFLARCYIETISFNIVGLDFLQQVFNVFISIILLLFVKTNWWKKSFLIVGYFVAIYLIGYADLWKIGARRFIQNNEELLEKINQRLTKDTVQSARIHIAGDTLRINKVSSYIRQIRAGTFESDIMLLSKQIGWLEITMEDGFSIFILNRFIDNGSGIIKIPNNIQNAFDKRKYISGLHIRGYVKIKEDWYYVWFS
jgi:hypothetical protein